MKYRLIVEEGYDDNLFNWLFGLGGKVIIISSVFRHTKNLFESYYNFLLKQCSGEAIKVSRQVGTCKIETPSQTLYFLSSGTKCSNICGLRADHIVVDNVTNFDKNCLLDIISGFVAVSSDPIKKIKGIPHDTTEQTLSMYSNDTMNSGFYNWCNGNKNTH